MMAPNRTSLSMAWVLPVVQKVQISAAAVAAAAVDSKRNVLDVCLFLSRASCACTLETSVDLRLAAEHVHLQKPHVLHTDAVRQSRPAGAPSA